MFLSLLGTGTSEMSAKSDFQEQTIRALVCLNVYLQLLSPCVCSDGGSLLQLVCEGDFEAVLFRFAVQGLLGGAPEEGDCIEAYLERQVLSYLSNATEDQRSDR